MHLLSTPFPGGRLTLLLLLWVLRLVISFLGSGEGRVCRGKLSVFGVLWEEYDVYAAGFCLLTLGGYTHTLGYFYKFL